MLQVFLRAEVYVTLQGFRYVDIELRLKVLDFVKQSEVMFALEMNVRVWAKLWLKLTYHLIFILVDDFIKSFPKESLHQNMTDKLVRFQIKQMSGIHI